MQFSLDSKEPTKHAKKCLIVGVYEDSKLTPAAKAIDISSHHALSTLIKRGGFNGKVGQVLPVYHLGDSAFEHIVLVGCGKADKITSMVFRNIVISAIKSLTLTQTKEVVCYLSELDVDKKSLAWRIRQIVEASSDALYRFDVFKSDKTPRVPIKDFSIYLSDTKHEKQCEIALKQGKAIADSVTLTKNLANTPSNICTPTFLADSAKDIAKQHAKLSIKVLSENEMKKLGMGALLGVSQGSAEEAKLICLEYKGGSAKEAPVALVGKGVTFDTGGNSIKPADSMVGMKYDMCGAATVIGTLNAVASLKLPVNVIGVIPAVENMPGGTAYKPEDILTSLSGQTIEVISTDAEGRLILADALTYCERYKPAVVIDIATLTGAVVIALGFHASGLLANNETLAKELLHAGVESNDRAWELPLWDEYQEQIKSPFADMANTGGRSAGTITAACFLSRFTKKFQWAHLDVAGTAAMMTGTNERMATGRPVPMLVQYLIDRAGK
jgi:leucyl aminopeptidase